MNKERILYIVVGVLFVAYVVVEYYKPKPLDWTITFSQVDKNPYGGYILFDRLEDLFDGKEVSFNTLYELKSNATGNVLILTDKFRPSGVDIEGIFNMLDSGRSIFISSRYFSTQFLDSLRVKQEFILTNSFQADSLPVNLLQRQFYFPSDFVSSWFAVDSTQWEVFGFVSKEKKPLLIRRAIGRGEVVLSSTPLAFTNYGMLKNDNYHFAAAALKLIPGNHILYNRFYHTGRIEPNTPLRYVLSKAPLQWALYLTIFALLLYLLIGSRRTQRAMPVMEPLTNTTVHFIKTIGGLYYREGNHKQAAHKLIRHFQKDLSEKYYIRSFDEASYMLLATKSGVPFETVVQTFDLFQSVRQSKHVTKEHLKQIYNKIENFK